MTKKEKLLCEFYTYIKQMLWNMSYGEHSKDLSAIDKHILAARMSVYDAVIDNLSESYDDIKAEMLMFKIKYRKYDPDQKTT